MAVAAIAARIVAVTAVVIAAVEGAGAAVEDDGAGAGHRVVRVAAGTCLLRNMLHRKAANPEATIIGVGSRAVTTIGARKVRAARDPLPANLPRSRSFFRANRSQNIAANR
jgi:hypothetical protein